MKERFLKIKYTFKHKIAYLKTEKVITGKISFLGLIHDLDKLFMLVFTFKHPKEIQRIHRNNQKHHPENNSIKNEKDYLEMIIDWECARFTKPDKPLNAYDTLHKYYPFMDEFITPLLIKFKLNSPTVNV